MRYTVLPFMGGTARHRGFTLVELLVVLGIITVLIGILLPTVSGARKSAQRTACLSNMRQLGNSLTLFTIEHKGYLPKAWYNDGINYGDMYRAWRKCRVRRQRSERRAFDVVRRNVVGDVDDARLGIGAEDYSFDCGDEVIRGSEVSQESNERHAGTQEEVMNLLVVRVFEFLIWCSCGSVTKTEPRSYTKKTKEH